MWGTRLPGIAAGVLSIAASQFIAGWDANFTQFGLILFFLGATHLVVTCGNVVWRGAFAGAALGILLLMNQVALLVALPWIAFLLVTRRFQPRDMLRFLVPCALALVLVNLPWIIRNFRTWGVFVTRTNLGSLSTPPTTIAPSPAFLRNCTADVSRPCIPKATLSKPPA